MLIYENEKFPKKWETITVTTCPAGVRRFLKTLKLYAPSALKYVKLIDENMTYSKYRGTIDLPSYIVVEKNFAEKIGLSGKFVYIDKGWGDFYAPLEFDLSRYSRKEEFKLRRWKR